MRSIMCSVQDGTTIKEYEMTCEDEKINQFFERLDSTVIQPISINEADNSIRMYKVIMNAKEYDKDNKLLTYEDIKNYIRELHNSNYLDLSAIYYLEKSNGSMRSNEVRQLFREFFDLYDYTEKIEFDKYYINEIMRQRYRFTETGSMVDMRTIRFNTAALDLINFSIESKLKKQKQKVIKR